MGFIELIPDEAYALGTVGLCTYDGADGVWGPCFERATHFVGGDAYCFRHTQIAAQYFGVEVSSSNRGTS